MAARCHRRKSRSGLFVLCPGVHQLRTVFKDVRMSTIIIIIIITTTIKKLIAPPRVAAGRRLRVAMPTLTLNLPAHPYVKRAVKDKPSVAALALLGTKGLLPQRVRASMRRGKRATATGADEGTTVTDSAAMHKGEKGDELEMVALGAGEGTTSPDSARYSLVIA